MKTVKNLNDVVVEIVNILAKYDLSYHEGMYVLNDAERFIEDQAKIRKIEND